MRACSALLRLGLSPIPRMKKVDVYIKLDLSVQPFSLIFFGVSVGTVWKSGCQGTTWIDWVGSGAAILTSFTGSVSHVAPSWSGEET